MIREHQGGLSPAEIRQYSKLQPARTWLRIGVLWGGIAAIFALATAVPTWWMVLLLMPLMARQQMALGAMMHEGAHRRLFPSRSLNDHVSQLFFGGPLLLIADGYRRTHLKHHRAPMAEDDPDIGITGGYPVSGASLRRRLLRDITGRTYIKFIRHFIFPHKRTARVAKEVLDKPRRDDGVSTAFSIAGVLLVHGTLLAALTIWSTPWYYLLLWMLPQMTFLQVYLRIRGIAEHAGFEPGPDQRRNTRTVLNRFEAWWVAPADLNLHITHHLYPSVPWYHTRTVHQLLQTRGALDGAPIFDNYREVLAELVRTSAAEREAAIPTTIQ